MKFLSQMMKSYRAISKAAAAADKLVSKNKRPDYRSRKSSGEGRRAQLKKSGKSYPVGIVGERSYQKQIERLREGTPVQLWHEPDNPYDDRAVAVATFAGDTIGYLARDFWLRDALLDERKPCKAKVLRLAEEGKFTGVVLEVTLAGEPIGERDFKTR